MNSLRFLATCILLLKFFEEIEFAIVPKSFLVHGLTYPNIFTVEFYVGYPQQLLKDKNSR